MLFRTLGFNVFASLPSFFATEILLCYLFHSGFFVFINLIYAFYSLFVPMGRRKSPNKDSDREKNWDKIFNALMKLSHNLQKDRQFLEERIKYLNGIIYKIKLEQKVDSTKAELMLGLKHREAVIYKHRFDDRENEMGDLKEWLDYLSRKCLEPKITSDNASTKGEGSQTQALLNDMRKLKSEVEKYKLENAEVSALLEGKNSIWEQFRKMENEFTIQLRKKSDEIEEAYNKVQQFSDRAEQLQSSNEKLRNEFRKMEYESVQKSKEIAKLLKENELLKSRSGASSLLHPGQADDPASHRRGKSSTSIQGRVVLVEEKSIASHNSKKVAHTKPSAHKSTGGKAPKKQFIAKGSSSSSRRRSRDVIPIPETPNLFSSSFKVPKLKGSSSPHIS